MTISRVGIDRLSVKSSKWFEVILAAHKGILMTSLWVVIVRSHSSSRRSCRCYLCEPFSTTLVLPSERLNSQRHRMT
jgi:hypothetical protein